ncbi:MAG: hypothetical protein FWE05_06815 [Defluviitaleaceae bacterium]|nr:hypothetical protein [Defluviitaleaceae bacterium]
MKEVHMRLYHVSDDPDITKFTPRITTRTDMQQTKGLVWALEESGIVNFLVPRQCPRVYYRATEDTTEEDIARFFVSSARQGIAIESIWHERMTKAFLYIYEFDGATFYPADGPMYMVSEQTQIPLSVTKIDNLFEQLFDRNVEVRILPNLHLLKEAVLQSTLCGGMMRSGLAQPKPS